MAFVVSPLSGVEWQDFANQLLSCHYGPGNYQKVPDRDRGDAGLEGFTVSEGHAYQAYGCLEPLSNAERYNKQRNKLTQDIGKFISNRTTLQTVFGRVKITRWILFVPLTASKELVAHAAKKTEEVLAAKLPYVGEGFRVMICDEEQFAKERDCVLMAGKRQIHVQADSATPEQVADWADKNDPLVATLDGKIKKLPALRDDLKRQRFRDKVLKWFLEGQDVMYMLRNYPESHERVRRAKADHEDHLDHICALSGPAPADIFDKAFESYLDTVRKEAPILSESTTRTIGYEAVSDWLLRCPLDFPDGIPT